VTDALRPGDTGQQGPWKGLPEVGRRDFLKYAGAGAVLLGGASSLAGCSSGSSPASSTGTSGGTPKKGGTLTAALAGGNSSDTVDGQKGVNNVDFARIIALYDALSVYDINAQVQNGLAESFEPNADATVWTIKLKSGVEFHNGKTMSSDDVIFSINRVVKGNLGGASSMGPVDLAGMKKIDALTLSIPFHAPFATFPESYTGYYYYLSVLPTDFDANSPVGTGPFKYVSFTPGTTSTFVRNPNYWGTGGPYVDTLIINDFADETTQISALQAGQADAINLLSFTSIPQVQAAGQILIGNGGGMTPFTMRVDQAPFSDVRVRQAFRLLVDRRQMMNVVFGGHGTLGNDIFSPWDSEIDTSIPQREQDISQAKSLLAQAGQSNLTVTMTTGDIAQGTVSVAQVFAQQAKAAGVTVNLNKVTSTDFYGAQYLKWPFAQDYWYYSQYLPQIGQATLWSDPLLGATAPVSPFNETHFNNPTYTSLYNQAIATLDPSKRADIAHELQMIDYTQGGYIIPYFPPTIDGLSKRVHGVQPGKVGLSFGNYSFKDMWVD
jgi:peptide/nickel transport system substrate-binding protein